jgi:arylsulfatase A-like enzyme
MDAMGVTPVATKRAKFSRCPVSYRRPRAPERKLSVVRAGGRLSVCLLLSCFLACSDSSGPRKDLRLLLDGAHAPDVLIESRQVAWPPSLAGSRFLTGWIPGRDLDRRRLLFPPPAPRSARLELVNLERQARTLVIDFAARTGPAPETVRLQAGGKDLGRFPFADPLELPLPMERLALGRVPVELTFDGDVPGVVAAAVRPISSPGEGRIEGSDLLQRGASLVDLVRPIEGGEVLVGAFVPPQSPRPGQRFDLTVEREDGAPVGRFSWTPGFWNRRREIELPLGESQVFVRIRLRASGAGPAARWEGLGFSGGSDVDVARAIPQRVSPPRLIVVYVMDALRADRLGEASPTCNRLAREGMVFKAHRSVAPNTLPSTKALFTGRAFVSNGGWKLSPEDGPTLAERLRAAGYRTGLFSGNPHAGRAFGTDRGFEHVAEEVIFDGVKRAGALRYNDNAERVHAAALAWLRSLPPGGKAFLYLHTIHPHNPYDPPEPFRSRFTARTASTIDGGTATLSAIQHRRISPGAADRERLEGLYTGSFAYNDAELGRFLAALGAWASPGETLVAVTSDHGEELFDHGGVLHGYTLYEEMLRIPLIVWAPGRLRPAVVSAPTNTLDLHATLLDLAGLAAEKTDGRSLLRPPRAERAPRLAAASSVKGGIYTARSNRFKWIWAPRTGLGWGMGEGLGRSHDPEYLFDLAKDPGETVNLAGSGSYEAAWLRSRLLAWVERGRRKADQAEPEAPVDRETRERLRALGYANQP